MRTGIATLALAFLSAACSAPEKLEFPFPPDPPDHWSEYRASTIQGSDCPMIAGEYSEPPSIHRYGKTKKYLPIDNMDLYSSYIPFHRAERKVLAVNEMDLSQNNFTIRQPDASNFYFSYRGINDSIIEYHFQSDEGDFECKSGHIEFPIFSSYGMIEGMSVNFQIRNIIFMDKSGALIIQSTRGPYRGNPSKSQKLFSYEFYRYSSK